MSSMCYWSAAVAVCLFACLIVCLFWLCALRARLSLSELDRGGVGSDIEGTLVWLSVRSWAGMEYCHHKTCSTPQDDVNLMPEANVYRITFACCPAAQRMRSGRCQLQARLRTGGSWVDSAGGGFLGDLAFVFFFSLLFFSRNHK